jgi:two-component system, NarL family, sensor histidine kinase DegS
MLAQGNEETKDTAFWNELRDEVRQEVEQSQRELLEINLMLEQSQVEVNKLAQRNAQITTYLQQVQAQFDALPRADIRSAYDSALDAQQRLFVMRGQLEKLQSDRNHIERYKSLLEKVFQAIEGGNLPQKPRVRVFTPTDQTVEMMIQAQEAERQRLARQMHDEPAQALSNFILQTEIANRLFDLDQAKAREELTNLKSAATATFQKVRDFIFELRPMMLDDLGLPPTLSRYVEAFKEQQGLDVRLSVGGMEQRLEPYIEVMIFRAIQELLGNAARHSQATSIKVNIDVMDMIVNVIVEDNGKGFEVGPAIERGVGLKLIRDRVQMLNGNFQVESDLGKGTRVNFRIPATKTKVFA